MADERMGLDTEEQRRRYHKAQLGELEKFAGAALRDIQAAESRVEARWRAAVLALVDRLEQLAAQMDREAQHPKCSYDRMLYTEGNAKGLRYAVEQLRAHAAGVAAPEER